MNKQELENALKVSQNNTSTIKSMSWFKNKMKSLTSASRDERFSFTVGKLYFFLYSPKTKEILKYYDMFPLVIMLKKQSDGFIGLNLHYLPPKLRVKILIELLPTLVIGKNDDIIRFNLSSKILSDISKYPLLKPCLKKYLFSNIKSKIVYVKPEEWVDTVNLPFEMFQKESKETVWKDSLNENKGKIKEINKKISYNKNKDN